MHLVVNNEKEEIQNEAITIVDKVKSLNILNKIDYDRADDFKIYIKKMESKIDETFDPIITKAHAAHKEALGQKKKILEPFIEAKSILTPKMTAFLIEEENKRKIEEERIRKELEKQAEEERINLAAEIENSGDKELAQEVLTQETHVPPVIIHNEYQQKNVKLKSVWKWEITDFSQLPDEYKIPDEKKLNGMVKLFSNNTNIPGVRIYEEKKLDDRRSVKNI